MTTKSTLKMVNETKISRTKTLCEGFYDFKQSSAYNFLVWLAWQKILHIRPNTFI